LYGELNEDEQWHQSEDEEKDQHTLLTPYTHELPETVSWQDMAVMSLYNVTED
jgi:hypothetical protein